MTLESTSGVCTTADGIQCATLPARRSTAALRALWRAVLPSVVGLALVSAVFWLIYPHWIYPVHAYTDVTVDYRYANAMVVGKHLYQTFHPEYPPLAVWLVTPPVFRIHDAVPRPRFRYPDRYSAKVAQHHLAVARRYHHQLFVVYETRFALEMYILAMITSIAVAVTARRAWRSRSRALLATVTFAVFLAALGPIVENRFDIAVALIAAIALLCMVRRWYVSSALLLGLGFALKLTPAVLLPLVLLLVGWHRKLLWAVLAFVVGAAGPFVPYLIATPGGVAQVFLYHARRPLEIESVTAVPVMIGHWLLQKPLTVGLSFGSWFISGPGTGAALTMSTPLVLMSVAVTSALLYRRRAALRAMPQKLPLATLALYLSFLCFDKVLSPQYILWLAPAAALLILDDLYFGLLMLAIAAFTQWEFPVLFAVIRRLHTDGLTVLVTRDLLLIVALGLALHRIWRLPVPGEDGLPAGAAGAAEEWTAAHQRRASA